MLAGAKRTPTQPEGGGSGAKRQRTEGSGDVEAPAAAAGEAPSAALANGAAAAHAEAMDTSERAEVCFCESLRSMCSRPLPGHKAL